MVKYPLCLAEGEYMVVDGAVVRHGNGKQVDGKDTYAGEWHYDAMHGKGNMLRVRQSPVGKKCRALHCTLGMMTLDQLDLCTNPPAILDKNGKGGHRLDFRITLFPLLPGEDIYKMCL